MHGFHLNRKLDQEFFVQKRQAVEFKRISSRRKQGSPGEARELRVESLNKCIGELQRETEEQRLALQVAQYGFVESRREQVRLRE